MSRVQHVVFQVDSDNKKISSNSNTDFIIETDTPIAFERRFGGRNSRSTDEWVYSVRAENILIPHSFYNVNSTNNTLSITETPGGTFSITIGEGNYTMTNFITELESELNAASLDGNTYSAIFDDVQGKLTYSYTGASTSTQFNDSGSTSFDILGLNTGVNHSFTVASPLISQKVSFLNKIRFLNLLVSGDLSLSNHWDTRGITSILAKVPILADPFTDNYLPNDRGSNFFRIDPSGSAKRFRVQLLDEQGAVVDLNGEGFHFDLVFYKRKSG